MEIPTEGVYATQGNYTEALKNYFVALKIRQEIGNKEGVAITSMNFGRAKLKTQAAKEGKDWLLKGLLLAKEIEAVPLMKDIYATLAKADSALGNFKGAYENHKLYILYRDSIMNTENTKKTVALQMNYDFSKKQDSLNVVQAKKDLVAQKELHKQKLVRNGFVGGFALMLLFSGVFFTQRNKIKKEKLRAENALTDLKSAQEQLVKSEKMAAFGVMASRISHEIQNPMNFVNNFSELSQEMLTDLIESGSEVEKKQNTDKLFANLQKINEHGKRAATIVKQLQEHSIKGTAQEFFETKLQ